MTWKFNALPWRALPAIAALAAGALISLWHIAGASNVEPWYARQATQTFAAGDYRQASVCYARLMSAHPNRLELAFGLACSLRAMGQNDGATSLFATIAPLDAVGYAPAQIALAQQFLNDPAITSARMELARQHLMEGLTALPDDPQGNALMALILARQGQWGLVSGYLAKTGPLRDQVKARLNKMMAGATQPLN